MTLKELQTRSHALAREKGWWDGTRDVDEVYACFHSEVSEAWEEYRSGAPLTSIRRLELVDARGGKFIIKPEGFFVELADLCIRIADAAEAWGMELEEDYGVNICNRVPFLITCLHYNIARSWMLKPWTTSRAECLDHMDDVVALCIFFAKENDVDLWKIIDLKHEYNKTRARKHGKIA